MKATKHRSLGCYEKHIIKTVQCSDTEAIVVEEIMRSHIFHSTLDWQTVEKFESGAHEAYAILKEMWELETLPDSYRSILEPPKKRRSAKSPTK